MSMEPESVGAMPKLALVDPAPADPWAILVERTAGGDRDALAALFDGTSAVVHGLVLRIVRDDGVAEEVTGDVYLQVWRQAVRFDASRGTTLRWLLTVARTRAIDRLRARRAQAKESEPLEAVASMPTGEAGPEAQSSDAQRRRLVAGALAVLSPDQRRAVELAYWGGLSHSEVAAALGEPLGTVKTRIRVAMNKLRDTLDALGREML
jgi:RNA polymerase sigma-70 factor, ECF subfamily